MNPQDLESDLGAEMRLFEDVGFLADNLGVGEIRSENANWFVLAEDLNAVLMALAKSAMNTVRTTSWDPKAVAVRLLLRCCSNLQGIILFTERGMAPEARTLVRSLLEGAFGLAALLNKPAEFIQMLKDDSEASRKRQATFLIKQNLVPLEADRLNIQAAIDAAGKVDTISPKKVAEMGPLGQQYLVYQRLSDDSAHVSARAVHRHLRANADRTGWSYVWGPASKDSNAATLHHAVLAGIPVGLAVTQMLANAEANAVLARLSERFEAMPRLVSNL